VIYFEADGICRIFGSIDGLASGVLRILGDLCLIAGTIIRSGDCALSSPSLWLCCFEPLGTFVYLIFQSVYLVVLRNILLDSLVSLWLRQRSL